MVDTERQIVRSVTSQDQGSVWEFLSVGVALVEAEDRVGDRVQTEEGLCCRAVSVAGEDGEGCGGGAGAAKTAGAKAARARWWPSW